MAVLLLPGAMLSAATISVGGFTYTSSGTKLKVTAGPTTGDVTIPDTVIYEGTTYTVTEIYNKAFQKSQITSVTMPNTLTKVGNNAFEGCTNLASISFSTALTSIGSSAFKGCTALTGISLPATLITINMYSFDGCTGLTSVIIPDKVTSISGNPFQNCSNLRSFTLGAKISSFTATNVLKNSPVEEVNVSEANTKLSSADGVLYDKKQTTVQFYPWNKPGDSYTLPSTCITIKGAFADVLYLKTLIAPSITTVPNFSFSNCALLERVEFGAALSTFGYRCFEKCANMQTVVIAPENTNVKYSNGVVLSADDQTLFTSFAFASLTSYTAPEALRTIAPSAFYGNEKLKEVKLSSILDSIGEKAFYGCTGLASIAVPANVKYINEATFYRCRALTEVTLSEGLLEIGNEAFSSCYNLEEIKLPKTLRGIGDEAFSSAALIAIEIPDSVTSIGVSAFEDCEYAVDIKIGSGVKSIGDRAFRWYIYENPTVYVAALLPPLISEGTAVAPFEAGQTIYVPSQALEAYKADSAWNVYDIKGKTSASQRVITLTSPGTLSTFIPESEATGVEELTLNGPVNGSDFAYINLMAMCKRLDMTGATIVAGGSGMVTNAGEFPKNGVRNLQLLDSIALPANLIALADSSLNSTNLGNTDRSLKHVVLPSTLQRIGISAFENRSGLTTVSLPTSLKRLEANAFAYCEGMTEIEIPTGVDTIGEYAFVFCKALKDLKFNEGLKAIDSYAFMQCTSLTSLSLPTTLDSIGSGAFQSVKSMTKVTLPANVRTLASYAFSFNPNLELVQLPANLEYIGASCFSGCPKLTKATLPAKLQYIRNSAFSLDSALLRIDVPRSILSVGSDVFERCRSLKLATFAYDYPVPGEPDLEITDVPSDKLTTRSSTFANCTALESIYIGSRVSFLADDFLANTPNLKRIFVANPTPPDMFDGESAFTTYDADLYVPKASIELYRTNRHWKYFTKIHAIENQYNAIGELFDDAPSQQVIIAEGALEFTDKQARVSVTSLSGQLLYQGLGCRVEVPAGMYIVTVNSRPFKVMVK